MIPAAKSENGYYMGRNKRSLWGLQWVMVILGLGIAAVLLLRGSYILGLLIAVLATIRVVYVMGMSRRRRTLDDLLEAGWVRGILRQLVPSEFILASGIVGLDLAQARRAFDRGSSLAELATGAGVPVERLVDAIVSDASDKLDREVTKRRMTQDQASQVKARLPIWANRLVHFHKGGREGARCWT